MLKRGYMGTYYRISPAHLQRYVMEFAVRHNQRKLDTVITMISMCQRMVGSGSATGIWRSVSGRVVSGWRSHGFWTTASLTFFGDSD